MSSSLHHPARSLLFLALSACGWEPKEHSGETAPEDSTPPWADSDDPPRTDCGDSGAEPVVWYRDADGDGYGRDGDTVTACEAPSNSFVAAAGDCDDEDGAVNPGAEELCNGADDDCDDTTDEGFDADGDGHNTETCEDGDDCDDADPAIYTGAEDACLDGIDSDCDGADDACRYDYEGDLGAADAKLYAEGRSDDAGRHMDAGDIDGDGIEDAVVGAMWADGYQGSAWIVYGPISGASAFEDAALELTGGTGQYEGGRTTAIGDVDGDGYGDVFLGSPDATSYDAVVFLGPVMEEASFAEADVRATCNEAIECGHGGDLADIDGDAVADWIVGAGEEGTGGYYSGSVYVVLGPLSAGTAGLRGSADVELAGETAGSETGRVLVSGGDMDGDGVGDLMVTASYDSEGGPNAGAVHVVLGPITADLDLGDSDGKLLGASAYDYAGEALGMGDVDGDGLTDALVGAYASAGGAGQAYAVYGPATATVSLSDAEATIRGSGAEGVGVSLAAQDLDGDGAGDLLTGAATDNTAGRSAGAAYLYFGPVEGSLSVTDAAEVFTGEARGDAAGIGVGFGDLDGNGQSDILIGATGESTGAVDGGAFYVVYSGD